MAVHVRRNGAGARMSDRTGRPTDLTDRRTDPTLGRTAGRPIVDFFGLFFSKVFFPPGLLRKRWLLLLQRLNLARAERRLGGDLGLFRL